MLLNDLGTLYLHVPGKDGDTEQLRQVLVITENAFGSENEECSPLHNLAEGKKKDDEAEQLYQRAIAM